MRKVWHQSRNSIITTGGFVLLLALGVVVTRPEADPNLGGGVLSAIFDEQWVITGARAALVTLLLYLVASVIARVWQGVWLKTVGPVSTDTADSVDRKIQELERELVQARKTIDDLRGRVHTEPPSPSTRARMDEPGDSHAGAKE